MPINTNISFYGKSNMSVEIADASILIGNDGGNEKAGFTLRLTQEDAETLRSQLDELLAIVDRHSI